MEQSPSSPRYSGNSPPVIEPEGSLLYFQGPATGPYPEPDESNPHLPILFPEDPFYVDYQLPFHNVRFIKSYNATIK
jgi:hypothetical protein